MLAQDLHVWLSPPVMYMFLQKLVRGSSSLHLTHSFLKPSAHSKMFAFSCWIIASISNSLFIAFSLGFLFRAQSTRVRGTEPGVGGYLYPCFSLVMITCFMASLTVPPLLVRKSSRRSIPSSSNSSI